MSSQVAVAGNTSVGYMFGEPRISACPLSLLPLSPCHSCSRVASPAWPPVCARRRQPRLVKHLLAPGGADGPRQPGHLRHPRALRRAVHRHLVSGRDGGRPVPGLLRVRTPCEAK